MILWLLLHVNKPLFSAPWSHPDTGGSSCYCVLSNPRDSLVLLIDPSPMLHCTRWMCPPQALEHPVVLPSKKGKVQWHEQQAALKLTDFFFWTSRKVETLFKFPFKWSVPVPTPIHHTSLFPYINVISSSSYIIYVFHEWLHAQEVWNTFCVPLTYIQN